MQALTGYFMLATWIAMVWMAVKLVEEMVGAVREHLHTTETHTSV